MNSPVKWIRNESADDDAKPMSVIRNLMGPTEERDKSTCVLKLRTLHARPKRERMPQQIPLHIRLPAILGTLSFDRLEILRGGAPRVPCPTSLWSLAGASGFYCSKERGLERRMAGFLSQVAEPQPVLPGKPVFLLMLPFVNIDFI